MNQSALIASVTSAMGDHPGLDALFLAGSYGDGTQDDFSDIDFLALVEAGREGDVVDRWRRAVEGQGRLVMMRVMGNPPRLVNAIDQDWLRLDLSLIHRKDLARFGQDGLKPLHDPERLYDTIQAQTPRTAPAKRLPYLIEEFLRVLGLLPVALGRHDFVVGQSGVWHLRNLLTELLILETGGTRPRGALSLAKQLAPEKMALLAGLPLPAATHADVLNSNIAHARVFLPRARALAETHAVPWPDAFEAATRNRWRTALGAGF